MVKTSIMRLLSKSSRKGDGSIWDPMKKEKLNTFSSNNKKVTVSVNKQLVQVREERKLMTRLLVASRTRPDIDFTQIPWYV